MAIAPVGATAATAARTAPTTPGISTSTLGTSKPTFVGPAATGCNTAGCDLLTGPIRTSLSSGGPSTYSVAAKSDDPPASVPAGVIPLEQPRDKTAQDPPPPTIACPGVGCDSVSTSAGGAVGVKGIDAVDSATHTTNIFSDIEPPDQALCAGHGYVVEDDNVGEILVFNTALNRVSQVISLDTIMGLTGLGWSSAGDISCDYDYSNGGHWFFTEIVSTTPESAGGPFASDGCFEGGAHACREGIAVTDGSSPFGPYHVYFLNADYNPQEPGYPTLLNDFAKIATTRDAFLLFYDEFPLTGPGLGFGFNGAFEFAFSKTAMELGLPVKLGNIPNPLFNVAFENMGLLSTPNGTCASNGACWFSVIPAEAPDPTQWDNSHQGSGFMLESLDFFGAGDNRIAVFDWTGLANLNSFACITCFGVHFGGQLFSNVEPYFSLGELGQQKSGDIPLGVNCLLAGASIEPCPENGIATNGDNFTQASAAQHQLWGAITTEVSQNGTSTRQGAAYWIIGTSSFDTTGTFTLTSQGYVTAQGEDIEFPDLVASGNFLDGGNGGAIMSFTLNGPDYYPSSAYGRVSTTSDGLVNSTINIADMGADAQDGFTEYQGYPGGTRPRWGDYGSAIFLPYSGGRIYFSSEYIQYLSCSGSAFDTPANGIGVCGGTRDQQANWGTSVNYVVP
ncbi:MAG: hypothetical protein ACRDOU_30255 [Streptosporangiaceae bacterium]